jgi:hypothetical protein
MVLALETSDSNVGGMTVVARATPPIKSGQMSASVSRRRIF